MDLWMKEIRMNEQGKTLFDQFVMDEDYNVPDSKRDVVRIIASDAKIRVNEVKPIENHVSVRGKLMFRVLYVGDGFDTNLSMLEGTIAFEEMVYTENMSGDIGIKLIRADLQPSLIHSRKLRIRAMVELELEEQCEKIESIPTNIEGEHFYRKLSTMEMLLLHDKKKDTYRIKEEIVLPGTKETIQTILWTDVQNRKFDTKLETDELILSGELLVFCFYESPDGKMDWVEQVISYQGRITCRGAEPSMYHRVKADLDEIHTEIRMDEDGEMRIIGVEGTLNLQIVIYQEEKLEVLEDVYSLEKQCKLDRKEVTCERVVMQNHSKCKAVQKLSLPELRNSVLQICHSTGEIQIDHVKMTDEGAQVEGALHIQFLYVKANDEVPFDTWQGVVPFSYLIECNEVSEMTQYHISSLLEQLNITLLGGDEIEVKAVLAFHGFFWELEKRYFIAQVDLKPFETETLAKTPGVIGYIVKKGDTLWDLAKRYGTTKESIIEVNELKEEELKVNERILIFRENMSIL